jgi:FkbM family methyltransferase
MNGQVQGFSLWRSIILPLSRMAARAVPAPMAASIRAFHFRAGQPYLTGLALRLLRLRPARLLPPIFKIPDAPHLSMVASDSVVCAIVYWLGQRAYEGDEVAWWSAFCARASRVVEIGANVGLYTINGAASMAGDSVYVAVEPHPVSHGALLASIQANKLERVKIEHAAVVASADTEFIDLHIPTSDHYGAPAGAHIVTGNAIYEGELPRTQSVRVRAISMSALIAGTDLIKIDVEGLEADLLNAVMPTLVQNRPTIFIEVLPDNMPLRSLIERLRDEGLYNVFCIGGDQVLSADLSDHRHPLGGHLRDVVLTRLSAGEVQDILRGPKIPVLAA